MEIFEDRLEKFREVAGRRQFDLAVILENVHDPHNIGAVMRSCDAVGVREVFLLDTDPRLRDRADQIGHSSSSGAVKWMPVSFFHDVEECFAIVKSRYDRVLGTCIGHGSKSLYELDLTKSVALFFGNEHSGISVEATAHIDQNFLIPQYGFTESLNISVACAVSLYEASRQRALKGRYSEDPENFITQKEDLYQHFVDVHKEQKLSKRSRRINF